LWAGLPQAVGYFQNFKSIRVRKVYSFTALMVTCMFTPSSVRTIDLCAPCRGKAVADGAISYLVDHFVSMRVIKTTIVTPAVTPFIPHNQEHQRRQRLGHVRTFADGKNHVDHACLAVVTKVSVVQKFMTLANCFHKGNVISESSVFRCPVQIISLFQFGLAITKCDIMSYRGSKSCPEWLDIEPGLHPRHTPSGC
jgi:hypothetical protein